MDFLKRHPGHGQRMQIDPDQSDVKQQWIAEFAATALQKMQPVVGTLVETYLESRGLPGRTSATCPTPASPRARGRDTGRARSQRRVAGRGLPTRLP